MTLDSYAFTPWSALAGGVMIGLAAGMLVLLNGRIAGISGIAGGLLKLVSGDLGWRLAFLGGLLASALAWQWFDGAPHIHVDASFGTLVVAGLLVGLGTRYAGGCTSGHGVCGLSRFSLRSLVATLVFMAAGFVTVLLVRHGMPG